MVNDIVSSEILVVQWQLSTQYFVNYVDIRIKKIAKTCPSDSHLVVCVVILYMALGYI